MSSVCFPCPICDVSYPEQEIKQHVDKCLAALESISSKDRQSTRSPPQKQVKLEDGAGCRETKNVQNDLELPHKKSTLQLSNTPMDLSGVTDSCCSLARIIKDVHGTKSQQNAFSLLQRASRKTPSKLKQSPIKLKPPGQSQNPKDANLFNTSAGRQRADVEKQLSSNISRSISENQSSPVQLSPHKMVGDVISSAKAGQTLYDRHSHQPLADRLRPNSLDDYIGQDHVMGPGRMLRQLLMSHRIPSMILWGPPGCGKTTLAKIISTKCEENPSIRFVHMSAATAALADVKEMVKIAKNELKSWKRKTILFMDEIHRFNKLQQDSFLPHVEDGTIVLVGATTENPSFHINNALLSRCKVIVLEKLSVSDVEKIIYKCLTKLGITVVCDTPQKEQPHDHSDICIQLDAITSLASHCDGDARSALNTLQVTVEAKFTKNHDSTEADPTLQKIITVDDIKEALQRSHVQYDRTGEEHYNCVSALQKSIRGSDDNAAIYWLTRMLKGGEDPMYIARRLVVCASEDIGLADPQALVLAIACQQACHLIGSPECSINLAHCVTYLARAPKSNEAYLALKRAKDVISNHQGAVPAVPLHLRNAPTKLMQNLGYGQGYKYNHDFSGVVEQEYLPKDLIGINFFTKE